MKKRFKTFIIFFIVISFSITIFFKANSLTDIVIFSISLFVKNIFPSLFPMFLISSILVDLNTPYYLGKLFKKPMSLLFKCNGYGSFVFFMSMITGFPSSAKYINDLIKNKALEEKDCTKILLFTFFSNPLFIINTIGNMFFKSTILGIYMLFSHFFGNVLTGIIFRDYNKSYSKFKKINVQNNLNIFNSLSSSIKESIEILMNIFGMVTFFLIVINTIFSNPNSFIKILLSGLLEMTSGLKYLSISSLSLNIKLYLSMFFISFGGFCVHFQIFNVLNKKKVKYLPFLISRICHGFISILILFILLSLDKLF